MSKANPTPRKRARRTKSGTPGVYYREGADGRRTYEYVWRDAEGKQRWTGGFRTRADAQEARADAMRDARNGARVVPVKAKFAEFSREWLETRPNLRDSTRARYGWAIENHLIPVFGRRKLADISDAEVVRLVTKLRTTLAPSSTKAVLNVLSLVMDNAVRRRAVASNPVSRLARDERPQGPAREMRVLDRSEVGRLLDAAEKGRPLLATLTFCGLRISEALALRWADVDLDRGRVNVRWQLDPKSRERVAPKTKHATREVVLMPALAKLLREHRLASKFSQDDDPVFVSVVGTPLSRDNVRNRMVRPAMERAGLDADDRPKLRTHDLRHTFASLLIAGGADVVFVSRMMGHSSVNVTLATYAHLFDAREHADRMAAMLEAQFGNALGGLGEPKSADASEPVRRLHAT